MKKFITYILIFVLSLCFIFPRQQSCIVYAAEEDDSIFDYVLDFMYKVAELHGIVINTISGNTDDALYEFFVHFLDGNYGLDEFLADRVKLSQDGSMTVSEDLYNLLMQFIEENATQKVNISDYIYKYYPDKTISSSRVPVANSSYDYIMKKTGSEGKAVMDDIIQRKYYWLCYNTSSQTTSETGGRVSSPAYAYIDSAVENSVIFILGDDYKNSCLPYLYDKQYQTFEHVAMQYVVYPYSQSGWYGLFGDASLEVNKYNFFNNIKGAFHFYDDSSGEYNNFAIPQGTFPYFCGKNNSNYESTGSPFNYYGTLRFPIWVSQKKYVEYMTLFPNYNPEQTVVTNEDNSVTINNFYYPDSGGDDKPPTDYTDILEDILREISAFRVTFNLFIDSLNTKIQQEITELQNIYNRQWTIYEMLESIYNKIQLGGGSGGSATDLDEIVKLLKKIDNKLLYNNVVETIDTIGTWLDAFLDDDDDNETSLAKAALEEALQSRFPFSLMFTFQALINVLEAEPIEPVFEFPFKMEMFNIDEVIKLDFTMFEPLVDVLHWFMILGFIYKLMMLTPKFLNIGGDGS